MCWVDCIERIISFYPYHPHYVYKWEIQSGAVSGLGTHLVSKLGSQDLSRSRLTTEFGI